MKFNVKDKEVNINPASLRQIHELEQQIGSLADLGEKAPFDTIVKVLTVALPATENEVTVDWLLDNCSMEDVKVLNEMVAHFLDFNQPNNC